MNSFKYLLSNGRKFHHPEVARVLYEHEKLTKLVCGSPWFKLKDKKIPKNLIDMNFLINVVRYFVPINNKLQFIHDYLNNLNNRNIDHQASKFINDADVFFRYVKIWFKNWKINEKTK